MTISHKKTHILRIKVNPTVYDFFYAQYGDTLEIRDDSILSAIIPIVLTLKPKDYAYERLKHYKELNIIMRDIRIGASSDCVKYIHADNRHYISDRQQFLIARHLDNIFKNYYHSFMFGYMSGNDNKNHQQKTGILKFCDRYDIEKSTINYDMLKKSWDRSGEKKKWKEMIVKKC